VLFNGALGTPTSGTVTNLTGTASININGTVGGTTPAAVAATTGNFSSTLFAGGVTTLRGANVPIANNSGFLIVGSSDTAAADLGGSLGFTANTTSLSNYPMGNISARLIATGAGVYRSYMAFATTDAVGSVAERMRLTDTGLAVTGALSSTTGANFATSSGNVGIGTSTPVGKLSVNLANASGNVSAWDSTYVVFGGAGTTGGKAVGIGFNATSNYGEIVSLQPGAAWHDLYIRGNALNFYYSAAGASTLGMTLNTSGNVGIGTSSVESGFKLHVTGNGFFSQSSGTVGKVVVDNADQRLVLGSYFEGGVGQYSFISSTNNAETGDSDLLLRTGTTERARISSTGLAVTGALSSTTGANFATSSGNVGIGTSSPDSKLVVGALPTGVYAAPAIAAFYAPADTEVVAWFARGGVANPYLVQIGVNQATGYGEIQAAQAGIGYKNLILNRQGGNVGIGTTSPGDKLEIGGSGSGIILASANGTRYRVTVSNLGVLTVTAV
jgi:hypothetical protein